MRRFSALTVWLGILAMLMQLQLPSVHAASYADRSGDPLAYALCGTGASSLAQQLRDHLPKEVVTALDAEHTVPDLPDCHACVGAHAPAAGASGTPELAATRHHEATRAPDVTVARRSTLSPPARGPPTPA